MLSDFASPPTSSAVVPCSEKAYTAWSKPLPRVSLKGVSSRPPLVRRTNLSGTLAPLSVVKRPPTRTLPFESKRAMLTVSSKPVPAQR